MRRKIAVNQLNLIFQLSFVATLLFQSCHSGKLVHTNSLICEANIPFEIQVHSHHTSNDRGVYILDFHTPFIASIAIDRSYKKDFTGSSILIYQCAFCAPRALKKSGEKMTFQLSDFFENPKAISGDFYLDFRPSRYQKKRLGDEECMRDAVLRLRFFKP